VCIANSLLLRQHHTPYLAKMLPSFGKIAASRLATRRSLSPIRHSPFADSLIRPFVDSLIRHSLIR